MDPVLEINALSSILVMSIRYCSNLKGREQEVVPGMVVTLGKRCEGSEAS